MSLLEDKPYNFEHFRTKHLIVDAIRTWQLSGVKPGELAPDFELRDTDGNLWRLHQKRGRPVFLHFGSPS